MIHNRRVNDTDTFTYDTVTDGVTFRVRYHKYTPRWSGKWYWLKRTDDNGERVIREFEDEDLAYAAVVSDAEHRITEGDRWISYDPTVPAAEVERQAEEERNANDIPF